MIPGRNIYPFRRWFGEALVLSVPLRAGETRGKPHAGRVLAAFAKQRLNWSHAAGVGSATTSPPGSSLPLSGSPGVRILPFWQE